MKKFLVAFISLICSCSVHAEARSADSAINPGRVICDYFRDVLHSPAPSVSFTIGFSKLEIPNCSADTPEYTLTYDAYEKMDYSHCAGAGWANQSGTMDSKTVFESRQNRVSFWVHGDDCELVHENGFDGYRSVNHSNQLLSVLSSPIVTATVDQNELNLSISGSGRIFYEVDFHSGKTVDDAFSIRFSLARVEIGSEPARLFSRFALVDESLQSGLIYKETWQHLP